MRAALALAAVTACTGPPAPPPAVAAKEPAFSCQPGARRPRDRCNDCVCSPFGEWRCSDEPCVTCPEADLGEDDPKYVNRDWIRNASDTLCCRYPVRALPLDGWRVSRVSDCWEHVMPGYWREPRMVLAVDISLEVLIAFAARGADLAQTKKAAIRLIADAARDNPSSPVNLTVQVTLGETSSPALDRALGRRRGDVVRALLIRAGVAPKRIRIEAIKEVVAGYAGVKVYVSRPSPVVGGSKTCVDGTTIEAGFVNTGFGHPTLEVCRNTQCTSTRIDLARILGQGESSMMFALGALLAGGVQVSHLDGALRLAFRINAPKGELADGDVYRAHVAESKAPGDAIGFTTAVGYGTWVPDAPGALPDACLDSNIRMDLLPIGAGSKAE